jgi:Zn-finger in Ran binding protein and others
MQSPPLQSYMSTPVTQPTPTTRAASISGNVPFRAGDWKCGSENCGYHNFAKNVTCLRCGASRAHAALIADSSGGLNTPVGLLIYSGSSQHPSDSMSTSSYSSSQYAPSQGFSGPHPPSQSYPPHPNQGYSGGQNAIGGMGMGGSGRGPQIESGDWTCLSCGYSNFRRRSNCLRCSSLNPNLMNPSGGNMLGGHQSLMRNAPQQASHPPQLAMLDTSVVESFLNEDLDKPSSHHSRVPQSAGAIPSSNFLTRSMNSLSLGPLSTNQYGGQYGTIGGGPMTAPPGISDDEYELGSRSASAVDRLGSGGFFSSRSHEE